jgi:hypothetical protein
MEQQLTVSQLRRSKAGSTLKVSQSPNKEDVIRKRMLNVIWKRSIPALTAKRSTASTFIACPWRNACGTRITKDTASHPSVMSS